MIRLVILFFIQTGTIAYAQNSLVSYELWYNNDFENRTVAVVSESNHHNLLEILDVSVLPEGINTIHVRYKQSDGKYSVPLTKTFIKLSPLPEFVRNNVREYELWYNNDFANRTIAAVSESNHHNLLEILDVSVLPEGINTIHVRYKQSDGKYSVPLTKTFIKLSPLPEFVNNNVREYELWYNNDFANRTITVVSESNHHNLLEILDVSVLPEGINTIHVRYKQSDGKYSVPLTKTFIKLSPLPEKNVNNTIASYKYWFDDDFSNVFYIDITEPHEIGIWIEELNLSEKLFGGEHSISIQFSR
ncbi:MAG: hypothetical protein M0R02_08030 [Bacteroidales bacterium]|nr:hypothetical protein [Bacteroidales bacterium]